jgi:N-acetylmuramoyl-L-alanine amidase
MMKAWTRRQILKATLVSTISVLAAACQPIRQGTASARSTRPKHLTLISRSAWGALPPNLDARDEHGLFDPLTNPGGWLEYPGPLASILRTVVIHHSALDLSFGPLKIQALHQNQKGFADVGYHYLIDDIGKIYEGRDIHIRGAHTGGFNTGTIGLVLLGNFETLPVPPLQLATAIRLVLALTQDYGLTHLAGHRDFQPDETVCPGENLEPLLPTIATETNLLFGTGGYVKPAWVND